MGFLDSRVVLLVSLCICGAASCSTPDMLHESYAGKSEFRSVNRKQLGSCLNPSPYLAINVSTGAAPFPDEAFPKVTVAGVLKPDDSDWIAMITPSNSRYRLWCPLSGVNYIDIGDLASHPLSCNMSGVVNFRTDVEFVLFSGGFKTPCVLERSGALQFANPAIPLYGHLSSTDSKATSMRLTWVSGDGKPQPVQYGGGNSANSETATFTQKDMCSIAVLPSPAKDFGWHDPGYIHSAVMTGLQPSQSYTYRYGSDSAGCWSDTIKFRTPPAAGSDELSFVIYGDMGKAPLDP
ncbi:probable inactive purple acid phosphatase 1 [Phragmites australis]|uniref:probable inactive purple acid phosphatase 1 n=1 Tax=Phragmites australis TaxID=29695 RepID=UPI002D78A3B0|nr:probable inactive purple acid phosphatase 1 [Phragmites australis]